VAVRTSERMEADVGVRCSAADAWTELDREGTGGDRPYGDLVQRRDAPVARPGHGPRELDLRQDTGGHRVQRFSSVRSAPVSASSTARFTRADVSA
jgi:hypothetical protein